MAGNVRFHSKYHGSNHHTNVTPGMYDSATDPIASPENPFQGDFYLNGTLSAKQVVGQSSYVQLLSAGGYATNVKSITGNYSVQPTDQTLFLNGISAATIQLPPASAVPAQEFTFKSMSSTATITISAYQNDLIEMTYNLISITSQYSLVHLLSFQNSWWVLYTQ